MAGVEAWVLWWEAVVLLDQSFPLGLLAARATTWRHLVKGARTLAHLARLPGAARWVVVFRSDRISSFYIVGWWVVILLHCKLIHLYT